MRRTHLRNKLMDSNTGAYRIAYNKQRNYCISLIWKRKMANFSNLKLRGVTDSKAFWKKSKTTFFRKKVNLQLNITLIGKWKISNEVEIHSKIETVISNDKEATEIFNSFFFFVNIVPNLKFSPKENYEVELENDSEPILNYINRNSPPEEFLKMVI